MDDKNTLDSFDPKQPPPAKGDKVEVIKILILAVISFLGGFALVFIFLRPPASDDEVSQEAVQEAEPDEETAIEPSSGEEAPMQTAQGEESGSYGGYAPSEPGQAAAPAQDEEDGAQPSQGDAPAEVPPGRTPDGVAIDGDAFYLKCWDSEGQEKKGSDCDKLSVLEKRFSTRLYVVDECRNSKAGAGAGGKLSVAAEVDFSQGTISFWSGASSEIKNASQIGTCLREKLAGLPISGIDHKFARYRFFHTVLFGNAAKKAATEREEVAADGPSKPSGSKGRLVDVVKDRVRVRKTPVDGDIIGKISSGNQVRLLKKKDGWCNILTPNDNNGWMICDALDL